MIAIGARNTVLGVPWVPASSLSETLSIPRPTVVNILRRLTAAGLLESREGKNGGVRLAQPAQSVTLADIFEAIERNRPLFNVDLPANPERKDIVEAKRLVLACFQAAEANMKETLRTISLDSLFGCPNTSNDKGGATPWALRVFSMMI